MRRAWPSRCRSSHRAADLSTRATHKRVEQLLTKRREYFLTDEDVAELNSLLLKREEIEIKYRISEADTDGFSKLEAGIDAAVARAEATGSEVGIDVYRNALVAGAEGMQAVIDYLNK